MSKFYITTPIYYINSAPHIGSAYTTLAADVLARYHQMLGEKTFFLTGTDEHGAKIEAKAREVGVKPQRFADEMAAKFELAWDELNLNPNRFIRTTEEAHILSVQNALQIMYDKGDIYKGKYEGLYCVGCEQFKSRRDLVNGKCPEHGIAPERMSEECYMFRLSKYQDKLLKKIKSDEFKISPPERKNEIISFYEKEGLNDIAFSRKNVKWGIPLPWDKSQTAYVWADAFLNYLTGLDWDGTSKKLSSLKFFPPDVQLMSKDIMRVHTTIWPAMLLSLGLPLPKEIFVHGFFLVDGQKMSKSLGNVIAPGDLIKKYGVDAARYLLMSAAVFGHDGDISWSKFGEKYNADLANGIGNLLARSAALAEKMQNTKIKMQNDNVNVKIENWGEHRFNHGVESIWDFLEKKYKNLEIDKIIVLINSQVQFLNNYITVTKPWELIKNKDKRAGRVMYNILERLRQLAWMIWPFMPETAEKIWKNLEISVSDEIKKDFKEAIKWGGLSIGVKPKKGESLFPRV